MIRTTDPHEWQLHHSKGLNRNLWFSLKGSIVDWHAMSELAYLNLDLLIERAEPDYTVRILASPAGESRPASFRVPFSDLAVENFLLRIGRPRPMSTGLAGPRSPRSKTSGAVCSKQYFLRSCAKPRHQSKPRGCHRYRPADSTSILRLSRVVGVALGIRLRQGTQNTSSVCPTARRLCDTSRSPSPYASCR
jgi:hypothetical protein